MGSEEVEVKGEKLRGEKRVGVAEMSGPGAGTVNIYSVLRLYDIGMA